MGGGVWRIVQLTHKERAWYLIADGTQIHTLVLF